MLLYDHVPGFDGLRVPARFGMIVALFLAVLAGYGARAALRRRGAWLAALLSAAVLIESAAVPLRISEPATAPGFRPPPRIVGGQPAPPIYGAVKGLPPGSAIAEFPFGEPAYDLLYMFYSTEHWVPLVNGYSGNFPPAYPRLQTALRRPWERPADAWSALISSGATHALVHADAYLDNDGRQVVDWLLAHGARPVAHVGDDRLFALGRN
jgi:hypothetical protein